MSYADTHYYLTEYFGREIPTDTIEDRANLERLLARSSQKIDEATFNRSRNWDALSDYERHQVKMAVCAEAEALYANGDNDSGAGSVAAGEISSYSIGDVTVNYATGGSSSSSVTTSAKTLGLLSEKAARYLNNTRLISRIL